MTENRFSHHDAASDSESDSQSNSGLDSELKYEDRTVRVDENGVTIKSYSLPGRQQTIAYADIEHVELIDIGALSGRYRLVGFGFRRPRYFFTLDRSRSSKHTAVAFHIGRAIRPVVSPDDPDRVAAIVVGRLAPTADPVS